jgi:hypothetical protein
MSLLGKKISARGNRQEVLGDSDHEWCTNTRGLITCNTAEDTATE